MSLRVSFLASALLALSAGAATAQAVSEWRTVAPLRPLAGRFRIRHHAISCRWAQAAAAAREGTSIFVKRWVTCALPHARAMV